MNIAPRQPEPPAPPTGERADDPRRGRLWAGAERAGPPDAALAGSPGGRTARPFLHHRRDGILPAVAGALSVGGATLTGTGGKGDVPPELHPLVRGFLEGLPAEYRERHVGRCPEAVLLSRYLTAAEADRTGRKAGRALTEAEARKALKQARLTARHVREDGDPRHGDYAPPCRSCARLLEHFGVTAVDPGTYSPCASGAGGAPGGGEGG